MTLHPSSLHKGSMIILTLVFAAIFFLLVSGLAGFVLVQKKAQTVQENREMALQIAEAGLDYYKWFLAHYPDDFTDGTGNPGPYEHTYSDPEGGDIGVFSLDISGTASCGETHSVDIVSTGWTLADPQFTRTVSGRYARPSVAEYAYILNSNVWIGSSHTIIGPYHSNGGIRMDGTNESTVSSGVATWQCTSSFGCSGTQTRNGVFGAGGGYSLWQYPVPPIDFAGITLDLNIMKSRAQSSGLYFAQFSGQSPRKGYRLILKSNGTVDVYRVNASDQIWSTDADGNERQKYEIITNQTFVGNYTIPANCALIYVEDQLWIEGVVKGKITIASADKIHPVYNTDVIINGNITYSTSDGSDGLTLIAEQSIRIPLLSPNNMTIQGILVAQNGYFGRDRYRTDTNHDVPESYNAYVNRNSLAIHGTIVSNGRVGTQWTCGGTYCGGYLNRTTTYDRNLATSPPPLTPYVSDDFRFIEWREEN